MFSLNSLVCTSGTSSDARAKISGAQESVNWFFIFFFISGFCSVLYELVWLRLSMAQFGVTTAMVSIVLSVFMAGLGLGSWASGRWIGQSEDARKIAAIRLYAVIELLIGVCGVLVPRALLWGGHVLENAGPRSSLMYYCWAGLWVCATLLPGCTVMGATLPVGMRAIREFVPAASRRSFSYLYTANVAGAVVGTSLPLFLIEWLGFGGTVKTGVAFNVLITLLAFVLFQKSPMSLSQDSATGPTLPLASQWSSYRNAILVLLFLSGLTSMAMEVVWVRQYTPFLGTVVYAFASILWVYLAATLIGSVVYRHWFSQQADESPYLWIWLAPLALLPLLATIDAAEVPSLVRVVAGISPFTGMLGLITPMLVDRFSGGDSKRAGIAYAVNIVGCILGPLFAGFGLLPFMSERWSLIVLALPWLIVGLTVAFWPSARPKSRLHLHVYASLVLVVGLFFVSNEFEDHYPRNQILRDSTATVIATGTGFNRQLLINGYGITSLTTITKVMAHLPLAFLDRPPQNALVICFGMGTTFRSLHSWGIPVTAVELVPSVPRMFWYYHSDAEDVLRSPLSRVVIDDGRRYLERTGEQYDVITVDPPPPLQAAGSSLLYSKEFYQLAKRRLRAGGILQQWVPATSAMDTADVAAIARSIRDSFRYVRAFEDDFGIHFLCSDQPIPGRTAEELVTCMPPNAIADFTEWSSPGPRSARETAVAQFSDLLDQELEMDSLIAASPDTPALTDDRPINEYYAYRMMMGKGPVEDPQSQ